MTALCSSICAGEIFLTVEYTSILQTVANRHYEEVESRNPLFDQGEFHSLSPARMSEVNSVLTAPLW